MAHLKLTLSHLHPSSPIECLHLACMHAPVVIMFTSVNIWWNSSGSHSTDMQQRCLSMRGVTSSVWFIVLSVICAYGEQLFTPAPLVNFVNTTLSKMCNFSDLHLYWTLWTLLWAKQLTKFLWKGTCKQQRICLTVWLHLWLMTNCIPVTNHRKWPVVQLWLIIQHICVFVETNVTHHTFVPHNCDHTTVTTQLWLIIQHAYVFSDIHTWTYHTAVTNDTACMCVLCYTSDLSHNCD